MLLLKQPEYGWFDRGCNLLLRHTLFIIPFRFPKNISSYRKPASKQLYFFEESGHGQIMVETVLAEVYP